MMKGWTPVTNSNRNQPKLLLVDARVLPDVFERVVEAKRLLAVGKVKNLSEAAKEAGISRSALYKYKDYVFMHNENIDERVITLNTNLEDRPGVLSGIINELSHIGANILTVNQNIPVDGVAPVSMSARLGADIDVDVAMRRLEQLDGVVEVRVLTTR
ncbi:MAG: ACT domain-containing protein [Angelakisella sp.]